MVQKHYLGFAVAVAVVAACLFVLPTVLSIAGTNIGGEECVLKLGSGVPNVYGRCMLAPGPKVLFQPSGTIMINEEGLGFVDSSGEIGYFQLNSEVGYSVTSEGLLAFVEWPAGAITCPDAASEKDVCVYLKRYSAWTRFTSRSDPSQTNVVIFTPKSFNPMEDPFGGSSKGNTFFVESIVDGNGNRLGTLSGGGSGGTVNPPSG